ncbi:cardiolipin synthase [Alienimonas sp. DA493]|uniref:cardiolipin synthase n=1 Tax=Alienimonas sp. DA493 TaxID=3373605 RepID=UPI003753FF38
MFDWLPVSGWLAAVLTVDGYLLTLVLVRWVLLLKKDSPASTVAWIMAIVLVPYLGGLLFLVFGVNRVNRRAELKAIGDARIDAVTPSLNEYRVFPSESTQEPDRTLMRLQTAVGRFPAVGGNRVEVLDDTNRTLGLIRREIEAATSSIHLEYYIWKPDRTGTALRDLLVRKAAEGVEVRFLYDGIGSLWLTRRWLRPLREAGAKVASFLPGASLRERWSLNLRNHRKIVVVDGKVAFTGGMNVGDEYLGLARTGGWRHWFGKAAKERRRWWRDTHLRVEGPGVLQLQQVFAEDWYFATGVVLGEEEEHEELYPEPVSRGSAIVQCVPGGPSGPTPVGERSVPRGLPNLFFTAITGARKTIDLTTGYFVPPLPIVQALEAAAWRGVRVRLLVPGVGGKPWTIFAGRSDYDVLLRAGVEIHEYAAGTLHAKTLTIDGTWSLVGSANLDARSFFLNFEVNLALFDDRTAERLVERFDADLKKATRITPESRAARAHWRVLAENFCRMFAPVF